MIIWWFLLVFGLTYLITAAQITARPRHFLYALLGPGWGGWLTCAPCASFWVGVGIGVWELDIVARLIGEVALSLPVATAIASRLIGGILAMGAVSAFQFATRVPIAELVADEAAGGAAE